MMGSWGSKDRWLGDRKKNRSSLEGASTLGSRSLGKWVTKKAGHQNVPTSIHHHTTTVQLSLFTCKIRLSYIERCWGLKSFILSKLLSKTGTNRPLWWWYLAVGMFWCADFFVTHFALG